MKVKKFNQFINEKLGVPDNIINSAKELYNVLLDFLLETYNKKSDDFKTVVGNSNTNVLTLNKEFLVDLRIADIRIKKINFSQDIHLSNEYDMNIVSLSVNVPHKSEKDFHIIRDKSIEEFNLKFSIVCGYDKTIMDIHQHFLKEKSNIISILSHELKHVYDKIKMGREFFVDIIEYGAFLESSNTKYKELNNFFYYLYLVSKAENLVRPTEVAALIEDSGITKKEFKEFIQNTDLYSQILKVKNWKYEDMKKKLLEQIRDKGLPKGETPESVLENILKETYFIFIGNNIDAAEDIIGLNTEIGGLLKLLGIKGGKRNPTDSEKEFMNNFLKKRILFESPDDFFKFWEKKLNFTADKVIKKISKLYDMCKENEVNPIMKKINIKSESNRSVVDPELYRKFVLKNEEKINPDEYKKIQSIYNRKKYSD